MPNLIRFPTIDPHYCEEKVLTTTQCLYRALCELTLGVHNEMFLAKVDRVILF